MDKRVTAVCGLISTDHLVPLISVVPGIPGDCRENNAEKGQVRKPRWSLFLQLLGLYQSCVGILPEVALFTVCWALYFFKLRNPILILVPSALWGGLSFLDKRFSSESWEAFWPRARKTEARWRQRHFDPVVVTKQLVLLTKAASKSLF